MPIKLKPIQQRRITKMNRFGRKIMIENFSDSNLSRALRVLANFIDEKSLQAQHPDYDGKILDILIDSDDLGWNATLYYLLDK